MELLHNGFRIEEGSCEGNAIYHVTTITVSDDGEYQCRVFFPGDNEPAVLSERRDLIVLGMCIPTAEVLHLLCTVCAI